MMRVVLLSIAVAAILVDGYVFGRWTDRWGNSQAVEQAAASLERVPLIIGDWQAEPMDLGAQQAECAGYAGYWLRRYQRRTDGAVVSVMLACGRPGPLSVHTPEVCYAGAGYMQAEPPAKYLVAAGEYKADQELWKETFTKQDALVPVNLRVFWTWRADNAWKVSGNPRMDFARQPVLYKMYITHEMTGLDERQDDAVCAEFIQLLLPELDRFISAQ